MPETKDFLSVIRRPIAAELQQFVGLFDATLQHSDGLLGQALTHIRQRGGKRMRPMLILLMARAYGRVNDVTQHAGVGLELLHTASLVHDDVVDESAERRGQASVNATYDNKVAVLVGDYLLSTALLHVSYTANERIVQYLAELGRTLAAGEILQLQNIGRDELSEQSYYDVIRQKTAALFEACAAIGALSAGATAEQERQAALFGRRLGMIFQIRDDIFDYYDQAAIGKPTGNDMLEGKLTLPALHALLSTRDGDMLAIAHRVKQGTVTPGEIAALVDFTKQHGGIEYAESKMDELRSECLDYVSTCVSEPAIAEALRAYVDFVIQRNN
ncbi:MAG: polyprenyl synthetase family protein [Prevotella sp.]|nr:polyprenyl synthetase family protein [Prevotella sp.]